MGLEDDGTPPADNQGLLVNDPPSWAHMVPAARRLSGWGWRHTRYRPLSKGPPPRREAKHSMLPKDSGDSIDVVQLLEESWFWRSNTASPSMREPAPSPASTSTHSVDQQRAAHSERSSESPRATEVVSSRSCAADGSEEIAQARGERSRDLARFSEDQQAQSTEARRTQSENMDDIPITQLEGTEPRAHSYAQGTALLGRNAGGLANPDPTIGDPLGTWAHRVFRFGPGAGKISAPTHIPGTPEVAEIRSRVSQQGKGRPFREDCEDDDAAEAAWRWRFNRRWRSEQAKQLDPDFGLDGDDEDGWETALGYLEACGPGYHLQMARTTSLEKTLTSSSLLSENSDYGNFLMDDSQKEKSVLKEQAEMDATKSIVSVAKKARDLYRQQQKIERDVQLRWGNAKVSMSWAGQYIAAVHIDNYGKFPFILAKVSDRTTAHRLLVRGRNAADKATLMRALTTEVQESCKQHHLPPVSVALLGSGTMEWSRERDHRINITSGRTEKGSDPAIQNSDDVTRLAGALTRASLPAPNRVSVNGEKLS